MGCLRLAVLSLVSCASASAQISAHEPATRARLVEGKTVVALALRNSSLKPLDAWIELKWLGPSNELYGLERRAVSIGTGDSTVEIRMPLSEEHDPLLYRLQYDVYPGEKNYIAFAPVKGILNLVHIADYAFALSVLTAGLPRPGKPFEIRALTFHPWAGQPVAGVHVKLGDSAAISDQNGIALLRVQADSDEDEPESTITAQIGDFHQKGATRQFRLPNGAVRIYTDKQLYQPGQTMHVRILATGGDGIVRADADHEIRIISEKNDLAHAARVTTSRFGVAWTDWEIPANAMAGEYRIEVESDKFDHSFWRTVNVRRYELPSFRVTAKPDRSYYLLGQKALVDISADYLFGKPVTSGKVRIIENHIEESLLEGDLDEVGRFRAIIDASAEIGDTMRFLDRHFTAFLTDASTNRTEPRKFDLRVSRDPLHVYVAKTEHVSSGRRLYITTYLPDGSPALTDVEVLSGTAAIGKGRTNRFGLARLDIPEGPEDELEVRAVTADGRLVKETAHFGKRPELWLETGRSLYRAGEAVRCRIGAGGKDRSVLLMAWNENGATVLLRPVKLKDRSADVEIPYDKRFGRKLSLGVASGAGRSAATRTVIFPGPEDLVLRARPARQTYRPGETARIHIQASTAAALGVAIIDESVLERAATDEPFARRRWFDSEADRLLNIGGLTERDLVNLEPAQIDESVQLVAEVLIQEPALIISVDDLAEEARAKFAAAGAKALEPVRKALDDHYLRTLDYPRDGSALDRIAAGALLRTQDPWMQPYHARFATEGANDVIRFISAGPDKQLGTDDDFCALEIKRRWFAKFEALIGERLRAFADYPANEGEFLRMLDEAGIRFGSLRDPWGSAMRVEIAHLRNRREVRILSAGPDRAFGSNDDIRVAGFEGAYFAAAEATIGNALSAARQFPRNTDQFLEALGRAGVDFDSLRDPWGHNYYLAFRTEEIFADRVQLYSYVEYNGLPEDRWRVAPLKRTALVVEIRSVGDDGVKGTYDDFEVASFSRVSDDLQSQTEEVEKTPQSMFSVGGAGTIAGVVTDTTGAVIPDAKVTLNSVYLTRADVNGWYFFSGVAPGLYQLKFESPGFQVSIIERVPVRPDHLTRADMTLPVGAITETVSVMAARPELNTSMAAVASAQRGVGTALSTPRIREYFPETLYWQPELITDSSGRASIEVKLADSLTTWRVAVIGSTLDGRIAEASAAIRVFQPFLVELDVPPVLTAGDEISLAVPVRNYLERGQKVVVSAKAPESLRLVQAVRQPGPIAPSSAGSAVLSFRADRAMDNGRLRVTALAKGASDAVEKPVSIHPDGERKESTANGVLGTGRAMRVDVPSTAVPGSIQAEVKFYPSLLAQVLESMGALLQRPYGCGEQTISSTYPNLLFLKAARNAGLKEERLETRAMKNLRSGYQRLLGYQAEAGGFTYWGRGDPDVALTAYALNFLREAKEFIEIDEDRTARAQVWLERQDAAVGSAHALQVQALARAGTDAANLDRKLAEMARQAAEFDEPYANAAFALAAIDAARPELARPAIERLSTMATDEQGAAYWSPKTNTPFYGWGRSGEVETTALVISALASWRKTGASGPAIGTLIDRGALFLLKNAGAHGAWATSQSTVRALTALLDTWSSGDRSKPSVFEVLVNGRSGGKVAIPDRRTLRGPVTLDISRLVRAGVVNEIALAGIEPHAEQAQLNTTWYEPWSKRRPAKDLAMTVRYNAVTVGTLQPVTCEVSISRPTFRGSGMMIAEIGLPPGVDVDRGALANIVNDSASGVDSFEVAPDQVTFYVWPQTVDSKFRFVFWPRFAMKARAAPSVLYDYYNPDERVVLAPERFMVSEP